MCGVFFCQAGQLWLDHYVLCAESAVGGDLFAVMLANNFLTDYEPGVTAELVNSFITTGKSQLWVIEVDGPNIWKYGLVVSNGSVAGIVGLIEKPDANKVS